MGLQVKLDKKIEEGLCIVTCFGSIDTVTYPILEKELEAAANVFPKVVMLDMAKVDYVSSIGISTVLKAKKNIESKKGQLVIANLQPQVKKVFDIVKVMPTEAVFSNTAEMDSYLYRIQKKEIEKNNPSF